MIIIVISIAVCIIFDIVYSKPKAICLPFDAQVLRRLTNLENEVSKLHRKLNGKV